MDRAQEEERPAAVENKEKNAKKDSALRRFGWDLTKLAAKGALPPLIGRRAEMLKITQILLQSRKNSLILVGEPGVGKSGIVEGFAQLLAEGKLPEALDRSAIIEISLTSLVAGTKYRGEFEERLEAVVREASCEPKTILFIDEIHLLLGAGSASRAHGGRTASKSSSAAGCGSSTICTAVGAHRAGNSRPSTRWHGILLLGFPFVVGYLGFILHPGYFSASRLHPCA